MSKLKKNSLQELDNERILTPGVDTEEETYTRTYQSRINSTTVEKIYTKCVKNS